MDFQSRAVYPTGSVQATGESAMSVTMEEQMAHMNRVVEDLSDVVARQQGELDRLGRIVEALRMRAAEQESDGGGGIVLGDERPPHY